jgi:hypothetical protein
MPTLDHMPDLPFYQCPAPDKKVVYCWYKDDSIADPETWPNTSYPYFMDVWRKQVHNVRLRKYSRFTKCGKCTKFKAEKKSYRGRNNSVPKKLIDDMSKHYNQIRRYRSDAAHRARLAATHPDEYISIAQDGTDQLGFGYPIGAETTAREDNPRLKTKIMISIVHGFGVYMYLLPLNVANGPDESIECLGAH